MVHPPTPPHLRRLILPTSSFSSSSEVGLGVTTGVTAAGSSTTSSSSPSIVSTSVLAPPSKGGVSLGVDGTDGALTRLAVVVDSKSALYSWSPPLVDSTSAWTEQEHNGWWNNSVSEHHGQRVYCKFTTKCGIKVWKLLVLSCHSIKPQFNPIPFCKQTCVN